ncbi:bifunctional proline dehydrogenase/L-glutamate gamma-semialdehyde dehydrogenase PutA [Polycladidibacter stylochi]|uniref:bifunctional proline dehydrogenase/L-glutamate gamma-semialdehyde dehydrogenase PutA n=1 Tax=Polycladidibacter stylochi TaxID=1807766 RepID=UPI00082EAE9E|nr:bifunctional proline dehydrogenase/L-glutamate gamma-semialdehyde dehydrogenase PutA [Pseudovibrio stylochi]
MVDQQRHLEKLRQKVSDYYLVDEHSCVMELASALQMPTSMAEGIRSKTVDLVTKLRTTTQPTMMESFLGEYGLSTQEGIALMCLAEALLRVPDTCTVDALIADKIAPSAWGEHLGKASSSLVNASTWALFLTGKLLQPQQQTLASTLRTMLKRMGEPVLRTAVGQAMKELGSQFVLGRSIHEAIKNATQLEKEGFTYSYDMLGEAAQTEDDAKRYHLEYTRAITALARQANHVSIHDNPGISVKLSALHPRYEITNKQRVMDELFPRVLSLAALAKSSGIGLNIDAEEADRLELSLDIIEALIAHPSLKNWEGFGVVVQAFGPRAAPVIDWVYECAKAHQRKITLRLVKGAYWDSEIKRAQTLGLGSYPVFTRKVNTDLSYLACAQKLLGMGDVIYPQFATHNAQTVTAIQQFASANNITNYEFQRLHGMGEALHQLAKETHGTRCRIYAPVGAHRDLLAYLVRRLLENGANSSFVHQIRDEAVSAEEIATDPLELVEQLKPDVANPNIPLPPMLFGERRLNARGFDIADSRQRRDWQRHQQNYANHQWFAEAIVANETTSPNTTKQPVCNPAHNEHIIGHCIEAQEAHITSALQSAKDFAPQWAQTTPQQRVEALENYADLLEENAAQIFALLTQEAGKTHMDAINELREAVDFARYYAAELERLSCEHPDLAARGTILCISPWNFPLAIFSGQILAALAAGNCVLAKPAPQTPLIAALATKLMLEAGIPAKALQLLPGGADVGAQLTKSPLLDGVVFTGSTQTAQKINQSMAEAMAADAPLIAETGGLNAMIVDSTALPEQAIRDIIASSFQSAGQRCSALRMLYIQEDVLEPFSKMLFGAMDELQLGDPVNLNTDVGPVIDQAAQEKIRVHCQRYKEQDKLLKQLEIPEQLAQTGTYVAPAVIRLDSIAELEEEIFGPVLHIATFKAKDLNKVLSDINAKGYGLTFGMHTRVDSRVEQAVRTIKVGNTYINRNQIGAVVGSQPFGGEGLSGTGPKAGGPNYLQRFFKPQAAPHTPATNTQLENKSIGSARLTALASSMNNQDQWIMIPENRQELCALLPAEKQSIEEISTNTLQIMPGPTGELNQLSRHAKGTIICMGPDEESLQHQAALALAAGNAVVLLGEHAQTLGGKLQELKAPVVFEVANPTEKALKQATGFAAIASFADNTTQKALRQTMAQRQGPILPLICERGQNALYYHERHLCVDTTAAGGNTALLAASNS